MTLPSDIILPLHSDFIKSDDPKDMDKYMRELNFSLTTMYADLADGVNGDFKASFESQRGTWTPDLFGVTSAGTGTYTHQEGYVFRQGLLVDCWFDILWTNHTGTGNLYLQLPYEVGNIAEKPFVGVLQPSSVAYTAGTELVINAIPTTFRGEIWTSGTGVATANQQVVATGQLIGHIRYIGKSDET